jgi:hypothetical protein
LKKLSKNLHEDARRAAPASGLYGGAEILDVAAKKLPKLEGLKALATLPRWPRPAGAGELRSAERAATTPFRAWYSTRTAMARAASSAAAAAR